MNRQQGQFLILTVMALLLLISALGVGGIYAAQGEREATRRATILALAQDGAQMSLAKYRHLALATARQLYQSGHPYLVNGIRPDGSRGIACNSLDYGIAGQPNLPHQPWNEIFSLNGGQVVASLSLASGSPVSYLSSRALAEGAQEGLSAGRQSALFASNAGFFAHAMAARRVESQGLTVHGSLWLRAGNQPVLQGLLKISSRYDPKELGNFAFAGEVCPVVRSTGSLPEITISEPLWGTFGPNGQSEAWVTGPDSPHPRVPLAFIPRLTPDLLIRPNSPCFHGFEQAFSCSTRGASISWDPDEASLHLSGTVEFAGDLEIPPAQSKGNGILIAQNLSLNGLSPSADFPFSGTGAFLAREQMVIADGLNGGVFHADRELIFSQGAEVLGHVSAPVVRGGGTIYGVPGLEHHIPAGLEAALGPEARVLPQLLILSDVPL